MLANSAATSTSSSDPTWSRRSRSHVRSRLAAPLTATSKTAPSGPSVMPIARRQISATRVVVPTVDTADARPRLHPRAASRSTSGRSVAAATTAITAGTTTDGTRTMTPIPSQPSPASTRPRHDHWASRSSHTGTPTGRSGRATATAASSAPPPTAPPPGPRSRATITDRATARPNTVTGRSAMRPRNPNRASPAGMATRTITGCTSTRRLIAVPSRRRVATIHASTSATSTSAAGSGPPSASAASATVVPPAMAPRYGTKPAAKAITPRAPARGTPMTDRTIPTVRPSTAARTAVRRTYQATRNMPSRALAVMAPTCPGIAERMSQAQPRSPSASRK